TSNLNGVTVSNKTHMIPVAAKLNYGFMMGKIRFSFHSQAGMHRFMHEETLFSNGSIATHNFNRFHYGYGVEIRYSRGLLPNLQFNIMQAGKLKFRAIGLFWPVYRIKKK